LSDTGPGTPPVHVAAMPARVCRNSRGSCPERRLQVASRSSSPGYGPAGRDRYRSGRSSCGGGGRVISLSGGGGSGGKLTTTTTRRGGGGRTTTTTFTTRRSDVAQPTSVSPSNIAFQRAVGHLHLGVPSFHRRLLGGDRHTRAGRGCLPRRWTPAVSDLCGLGRACRHLGAPRFIGITVNGLAAELRAGSRSPTTSSSAGRG